LLKQPEAERKQADNDQVNCHVHDRDLPHAPVGDGCEIGESRDREEEETRDAPSDAVPADLLPDWTAPSQEVDEIRNDREHQRPIGMPTSMR
jgi:hypothetical protein